MPTREVLEVPEASEKINVLVNKTTESIQIYNDATDATAWWVEIDLADWEAIKTFVNKQFI